MGQSNMTAIDFLGREIIVGDQVAFIQLRYRNLLIGTIYKITPKTLMIEHLPTNTCRTSTKQFHDQVLKVSK